MSSDRDDAMTRTNAADRPRRRLLHRLATPVITAAAAVAATIALVAPAQAAPAKPTPEPFPVTDLARLYASDISSYPGGTYLQIVDPFAEVRRDHPAIMRSNLAKVIEINNGAADDPARQRRALADAHDDPLWTMSDAFGAKLGRDFRAALAAGRLPKTKALFSDYLARAGGPASATLVEKYVFDNPRPFVVAPTKIRRYMRGGVDEYASLRTNPSYPSGHSALFFWRGTLFATMFPELGPQFLARAAEGGYHRIVLGVHYPLDVIGGAMVGQAAAADRRHDPEFRRLLDQSATEIRRELEWRCGAALSVCISADTPYLDDADAERIYTDHLTYGFPQIGAKNHRMIVPHRAVDLIRPAFPSLTDAQLRQILVATALPAGHPLDDQRPDHSSWQRIDLVRAYNAKVSVDEQGRVTVR